eukprot:UN26787
MNILYSFHDNFKMSKIQNVMARNETFSIKNTNPLRITLESFKILTLKMLLVHGVVFHKFIQG